MHNRITEAFAASNRTDRNIVLPFLTAGYPTIGATADILEGIEKQGVQICELGFPFSDPVADGPTIQASYTRVLQTGLTVDDIFTTVNQYRAGGGKMAILAMVSYSIVYRRGVERFCDDCAAAGFDGLIIPDLPLEECSEVSAHADARGLCNIMLISPTTPSDRMVQLAEASHGFVYFMSVAGITGERKRLPEATLQTVSDLKQRVDIPICIGFGISDNEMVREACAAGDGAIVGSAIIHRINDALDNGKSQEEIVEIVCHFVRQLQG